MAQTERVLVVSSGDQQTQQLEGAMSLMRDRNTVPVVFNVHSVVETLPETDYVAASIDALKRLIRDGDLEAIIAVASDDDFGRATEFIAQQAAMQSGIPLWGIAPGPPQKGDTTLGDSVFRQQQLPVPKIAHHRTFGFWFATIGTGLLSIAVTTAGTFSYMAAPPVGLLLATLAMWGVLLGSRLMNDYRAPSAVAAVSSIVTLLILAADPFSGAGASGSVLVPSNTIGWTWIAVVALGSFATLALPDLRAARASRMEVREGATQ